MKVKIELEKDESIEDAEHFLVKSIRRKHECSDERYSDEYLNQFHELICERHSQLVESILKEIEQEVLLDAHQNHDI